MKPVILVTGKNGQLGNELQTIASNYSNYQFVFTDRDELDITNANHVLDYFAEYQPKYCINAAAYTAVDKAETEKELAYAVNATGAENLAIACAKLDSNFIHVSTDYVYDGLASSPYTEDHTTSPVNYYGQTKLEGEELAIAKHPSTIVLRTSWVYSTFGNNFVKTMLRLMSQKESLNVVGDQYGSPTYARDLAEAIMHIISLENLAQLAGIYHFSNEGLISWYDFAVEIQKLSNSSCVVSPIPTAAYPTPAKRPAYSVMNKDKVQTAFNISLRPWKDSLKKCVQLLQSEK